MRHDSLLTRLGNRAERNSWRLWIEETELNRLARNNFHQGTPFEACRRPGTGLVIKPALLSTTQVSKRKGQTILSYEARDLHSFLGCPEVRVRISVGQITVVPRLRAATILTPSTEVWTIKGSTLTTPAGECDIRTAKPLMLRNHAGTIEAALEEMNLVYATEVIGNQRPGRVLLTGAPVMVTVASQFLVACGYGPGEIAGEFRR